MDQVSSVKLEPVGFDTAPNSSATEVPIKAEPDPSPTNAPASTATQSHLQFQQQFTTTSNQPQTTAPATTIVTAPAPGEGLRKSYNQVSSTSSLDSALSSKSSNNQMYHLPQTTTINHIVNNVVPTSTSTSTTQENSSTTVSNTNLPNFVFNTPSPTNEIKNINPVDNATVIRSPVLSSSSTTQQQQQREQQQTFTTSSIPTTLSHTNHAPPQSSTATTTITTPLFNPLQHQQTSQTQYTMGLGTGTTPTIISSNASTNVDLLATSNTTGIPSITSMTAPPNITNPATTSVTSTAAANVPEFLYQLIKMLTDDHRDIIEWSNGKIEVHNPHRLESQVLNKYFRHSKYASFQRQLNYFGFRKLAGKGKMAPCSYVNELATSDLRSLLKMKRKTSAKEAAKAAASSASELDAANNNTSKISSTTTSTPSSSHSQYNSGQQSTHPVQPSTALSSQQSVIEPVLRTTTTTIPTTTTSFPPMNRMTDGGGTSVGSDLKIAIGKGIKHSLNGYLKTSASANSITSSSLSLKLPSMTSLSGTNNNHTAVNTTSSNAFFPSLSSIPNLSSTSSVLKTGTINNPLLQSTDTSQQFVQQSRSTDPFTIAQSAVGKGVRHQFAPTTSTSTINVTKQPTIINPVAAPTPTPAPPPQTATTTISTSTAVVQQPKQEDSNVQFTFLDPPQLGMGVENCLTELQNNFRNSLNESIASGNDGGGGGGSSGMTRDTSLLALAMIPDLDTPAAEPTPTSNSAQTGGNSGGGGAGPTTVSSTMQQELKVTDDALMTFLDFPPDFGSD